MPKISQVMMKRRRRASHFGRNTLWDNGLRARQLCRFTLWHNGLRLHNSVDLLCVTANSWNMYALRRFKPFRLAQLQEWYHHAALFETAQLSGSYRSLSTSLAENCKLLQEKVSSLLHLQFRYRCYLCGCGRLCVRVVLEIYKKVLKVQILNEVALREAVRK